MWILAFLGTHLAASADQWFVSFQAPNPFTFHELERLATDDPPSGELARHLHEVLTQPAIDDSLLLIQRSWPTACASNGESPHLRIRMHGKGERMKKGYWVVAYRSVSDESALKEYGKLAMPAIQEGGGKALVRTSEAIEPRESGLKQRIVVVEFESFEKALATYNSASYQAALRALGSAAERDFRIVEGLG